MTVAIFVGTASIVLLVYWFRYTSLLILSTKTSQDFSFDIAHAHELQFPKCVLRSRPFRPTVSPTW